MIEAKRLYRLSDGIDRGRGYQKKKRTNADTKHEEGGRGEEIGINDIASE